ncbi:DNA helicase [Microbacterium phage Araxxi]|uniref:DNA helicase n=1 Tax=Microbacterium phage Araxxi TaxID=2590948 RepID=A0A516KT14_9CAUD|nr:DNA helicase [Microbacterium phage Araxxi]QDP44824.1 DNA helicase [Microbacterium phage Araxxi]
MKDSTPTRRSISEVEAMFAAADEDFDSWMSHQLIPLENWEGQDCAGKHLVHYPTGKGKTKIMLGMIAMSGYGVCVVIAPPITHSKWIAEGKMVGIKVIAMSHAKFRQPDVRLLRNTPIIVDEFHLLGGHTGKGWTKLDRAAAGLQAPLILGSATPNYNDAERCYCIVHVLNPFGNRGGFLTWLYRHCETENNPFGAEPKVLGFLQYKDAAEFLADQPFVSYLPDDAPDILRDLDAMAADLPPEFYDYHVDDTRERVMASLMEIKQRESFRKIVDGDQLADGPNETLSYLIGQMPVGTKWILFAARKTIARIIYEGNLAADLKSVYIDGDTSLADKNAAVKQFIEDPETEFMVGTASMATGTDGIDKVCKLMVIVDDTPDDSLRRQLVGRILPRGIVTPDDYVGRVAYRFTY